MLRCVEVFPYPDIISKHVSDISAAARVLGLIATLCHIHRHNTENPHNLKSKAHTNGTQGDNCISNTTQHATTFFFSISPLLFRCLLQLINSNWSTDCRLFCIMKMYLTFCSKSASFEKSQFELFAGAIYIVPYNTGVFRQPK